MSTNIVFNGVTYAIPAEGDSGWGTVLSNYFIALASGTLSKSGGSFALLSEVDFGATYGAKLAYIKSQATNPSGTGIVRLGNNEAIGWRNAANTSDLSLKVNASDILQFNGANVVLAGAGLIVNADVSASAAIDYSKLNLTGLIVNADIGASAAIAYAKLALTGSIVDADISGSAAIALSKLAALATGKALQSNASTGAIEVSSVTNTELSYLSGVTSAIQNQLNAKEGTLTAGTSAQYYRGDKTWQTLDKSAVGLSNVDNTSDANKPISTATQTALNAKADSSTLTAHTGASTGVHGVTGAVVGTTDAQNISNKIITASDLDGGTASNTSRITLPKAAKTTLDALTRKQGTIVFDTTSNKPYYDDGTNLKVVGSGSGGATNFLSNPDAETGTTSYATYKDAAGTRPVDGTGGTALYTTITTTSTNPLSGTNSFLISKSANDAQGEGVSTDFTIDLASKAKVQKVELDYIVDSGTFVAGSSITDSDLIVYLYDVTNSRLIEPSSFKFLSNSTTISDKFSGTFQTSSDSTSYRLIFHVASTSTAAWALKVDNISVSPSQYVYGTPITDWQDAGTITFTGIPGTVTDKKSRRVGDSKEYRIRFTASGAATTNISVTLDSTIDTSKISAGSVVGNVRATDAGTANYIGIVQAASSTAVSVNTHAGADWGVNQPFTWGNTDNMAFEFSVPILGWSSSVQMSDGYDGRVVAARMSKNANQSIPNAVFTKLTWEASTLNTADISNLTSDRFDIKAAGIYVFNVQTIFDVNATGFREVAIYKSGNLFQSLGNRFAGATTDIRVNATSAPIEAVAGDYFEIYVYQNSGGALNIIGSYGESYNIFSAYKLSGSATMSATETVSALYTGAPPTGTLSAAWNTITYGTKVKDSHGAYSSGSYTVPVSGQYDIEAQYLVSGTWTAGQETYIGIYKGATLIKSLGVSAQRAGTYNLYVPVSLKGYPLLAGETIIIKSYITATTPSYVSAADVNTFSITRSGGY